MVNRFKIKSEGYWFESNRGSQQGADLHVSQQSTTVTCILYAPNIPTRCTTARPAGERLKQRCGQRRRRRQVHPGAKAVNGGRNLTPWRQAENYPPLAKPGSFNVRPGRG